MKEIIFLGAPSVWLVSSIIWHFLITNNGFTGFETSMTLLAFYYLVWSTYFYFFKPQKVEGKKESTKPQ